MKVEHAYVCQLMCTRSLLEHLWTSHNHFSFAIGSRFSLLNEFQDIWSCGKKMVFKVGEQLTPRLQERHNE